MFDFWEEIGRKVLIVVDALLWIEMREVVHDAVLSDFLDTGPYKESAGLCGSGVG